MSISATLFLLVYVTGLALAAWKPVGGLCSYLWTFYMNPQGNWWGKDLPDFRWSLVAAIATLIAYGIHRMSSARADAQRAWNEVS